MKQSKVLFLEKMGISFVCSILLFLSSYANAAANNHTSSDLQRVALRISNKTVVIGNGIVELTLTNPGGILTGVKFNGVENLLETTNPKLNGGFWEVNWSEEGSTKTKGKVDWIVGTNFKVIVETEDQVEVSFTEKWDPSVDGKQAPLSFDIRYVVLRNVSGFYTYGIFKHEKDMPAFNLNICRLAFLINKDKFHYMAVADDKQRYMPHPDDRLPTRGQELEFPEAMLLFNPVEPEYKGQVDDKYQYAVENKDNQVHGWISMDPPMGFWHIMPSNEVRTGGPFKQDLTSHVGPATLAIFLTSHYAGEKLAPKFKEGEEWTKVHGPVFIYLNTPSKGEKPLSLWDNAKQQLEKEIQAWPYTFPASDDFLASDKRGNVKGTLLVKDRYVSQETIPGKGAYVGLAAPGDVGSWQRENKGYQFWTKADDEGNFAITNVLPGNYNLFATVPGFIGEFRYDKDVTITQGAEGNIQTGDLVFEPPRDGPTLWEIGVPNRSAAEFFVPDPDPKYVNPLYVNHTDKYRQYGLWERYTELFPDNDLVYTVGTSDYKKDWFYAQVTRKIGESQFKETTWQIKFKLDNVDQAGDYKLRLALASAHNSDLLVRINDAGANPLFSTGVIGADNAIARHGIHGIYWLFNVTVPGQQLVQGDNTIFLTQNKNKSPIQGIMYDYIRLEGTERSAPSAPAPPPKASSGSNKMVVHHLMILLVALLAIFYFF